MAAEFDKENIADGLLAAPELKRTAPSPKKTKKSRSLSMGPGALNVPLKEDSGNRRKSAFPAVKSILPSKEDEAKRREARRKSLANRRVSFAPEATLHTWDVIEYMRDATTSSSASSESTRRASAVTSDAQSPQSTVQSPAPTFDEEPPSTPPEQVEEAQPESTPANQRDLHQRKRRRRSSGIPPMNFNNPEDVASSSPYSGSSPVSSEGVSPEKGSEDDSEDDTAMSLDMGDDVTGQSLASAGSVDSTSSSSRLDEALRQAVVQAGAQDTQHDALEDEDGEMSMEITNVEIANAFKPWIQKKTSDSVGLRKMSAMQDQENVNPFSPAFKAQIARAVQVVEDETQDMSMDMTKAIGGILSRKSEESVPELGASNMKSSKRRRSSTNLALSANATGSPAKRPATRRSSIRRRRSSAEDSSLGDETMDLTMAIGGIQQMQGSTCRESVDTSLGDETMDFTMVQGGILAGSRSDEVDELNADEDLSMELTATLEKTIKMQPSVTFESPVRPTRSPRKSLISVGTPEKPAKAVAKSPKAARPQSPPKIATPQKSSRKSPRKSVAPVALPAQESETEFESAEPTTEVPATPSKAGALVEAAPASANSLNATPIVQVAATPPQQSVRKMSDLFVNSPLKRAVNKTTSLSDNIKLLSTPRKQPQTSPAKRAAPSTPKVLATPKKSATPKKTPTPRRSATPRKRSRVGFSVEEKDEPEYAAQEESEGDVPENERIQLQDFLAMTNIRFMDLTTTKRRHTGHPGAEGMFAPDYDDVDDTLPTLESSVAAAACTVPMLTMYQHSCHEMKNYIAGGRDDLRTLEAEVYENQPPLFREYMSAPPDERAIMDNQFKNMKTNARLQSKAGWHAWRSQLLNDLKSGLFQTSADFEVDNSLLAKQEELLVATLPDLVSYTEELEGQRKQLQERADELSSYDREELEAARERLVGADAEVEEKKRILAELQNGLAEKEALVEAAAERKAESLEEIKEAERVREEYRGWSSAEVSVLKAKVDALEQQHGWAVTSASSSPNTLTLTYQSDLELFFHPSSFQLPSATEQPNAPISLSYVGNEQRMSNRKPRELTTTKRFFLQFLRAHLHSIAQYATRITTLLKVISSGWDAALAVSEAIRVLHLSCMTDEAILSDDKMAVDTMLLLPTLQTKVKARFEIVATHVGEKMETHVSVEAKVVYGERYDEAKMGEFLTQFAGGAIGKVERMGRWAEGVEDLRARLIRRGRKT